MEPTIVTHVHQPQPPTYNVEIERNTKGYSFKIVVIGQSDLTDAIALATVGAQALAERFPAVETKSKAKEE